MPKKKPSSNHGIQDTSRDDLFRSQKDSGPKTDKKSYKKSIFKKQSYTVYKQNNASNAKPFQDTEPDGTKFNTAPHESERFNYTKFKRDPNHRDNDLNGGKLGGAANEGGRFNYTKFKREQTANRKSVKDDFVDSPNNLKKKAKKKRLKVLKYKAIREAIHKDIDELTKDNVATDAAHFYEQQAEKKLISGSKFISKRVYNYYKQHYTNQAAQAITKGQKNVSAAQRAIYKARYQMNRIRHHVQAIKSGSTTIGSLIGKGFQLLLKKNAGIIALIFGGILLLIIVCNTISSGMFTVLTSFVADEEEIQGVCEYVAQLDSDLIEEIDSYPSKSEYSDIDEFDINFIGTIGTNHMQILAYLTVKYSDFTLNAVKGELEDIHNSLYSISVVKEVQIRTREVTTTHTDPLTGETTTSTETEEYEYKILHVTVHCTLFSDYVKTLLTEEELEWYDILMLTKGNMLSAGGPLGNPFIGVDWRNFITCPYGYRIMDGVREFHPAIDISWGGIYGTEINAVHDGIVTQAVNGHSIYGNFVMLESDDVKTRYSHCSSIYVSAGERVSQGDVIARVGNSGRSTGPHLDIEVYRNGSTVDPLTELSYN